MIKYYIEIVWHNNKSNYIVQSRWFNTEEEAIEWARGIEYTTELVDVCLMSSIWDTENDTYINIVEERCLHI